ncbi:hypothetical protein [Streptomyces pseudovenezuelae]|uniref:hypothetical protein n=1 Tax=Streptomyces pseudovenezuelae TaxID=67350 RepID=UPI0037141CE8
MREIRWAGLLPTAVLGEREEPTVGSAYLDVTGDRDPVDHVTHTGGGEFGALDAGGSVGDDSDHPCSRPELAEAFEGGWSG